MTADPEFDGFLGISAVLTGYDRAELHATGCAPEYWKQLRRVAPPAILCEFLARGAELEQAVARDPAGADGLVRELYFADDRLGPLARALIQLWYLGQWVPLPPEWRRAHGASAFDVSRIVSTRAYKEGLVWNAIGAHPMGAKQQGFGAWALEPPPPEV